MQRREASAMQHRVLLLGLGAQPGRLSRMLIYNDKTTTSVYMGLRHPTNFPKCLLRRPQNEIAAFNRRSLGLMVFVFNRAHSSAMLE